MEKLKLKGKLGKKDQIRNKVGIPRQIQNKNEIDENDLLIFTYGYRF